MPSDKNFSRVRSFLWPIHRYELSKFVPMLLLFFLVSFNYHLLRITKDSLIITAPQSGAEVLPFIKVWAMLPAALLITSFFTRMTNHFSREKVFYLITSIFIVFYLVFLLFIYPNKEALYCDSCANAMQKILPAGAKGFIALIRYWMYSLYYIFAEFWSTVMVSILLWGFANDVTSVKEAKRFYALFGIGINSSGILAGKFGEFLSTHIGSYSPKWLPFSIASWEEAFSVFLIIIIINGIIAMGIHRWLHLKKFTARRHAKHLVASTMEEKPKKMSLRTSISYVAKSKYLIYIAVIVLGYNMVINFSEVLWKAQVKELFPTSSGYTAFTSKITFYIGLLATLASYFISGNVIRRFGWRRAALATPLIAAITGVGFFYFLFVKQYFPPSWGYFFGLTPLLLAVSFGALQNIFVRSSKYTLFDDTKEMAFIPLSQESKLRGKSAIDGVGSRLGKSGSSLILQILLIFFATPIACSGVIFVLIAVIVPIWIKSIHSLNKKFVDLTTIPKEALQTTSEVATEKETVMASPKT